MKKTLIVLVSLLIILPSFFTVLAENNENITSTITPTVMKKEIRNEIKAIRQEGKDERKNLLENIKNKIKEVKDSFARILNGEVTGKGDSSLTITKDGKIYTVNIALNTQMRRHFWGNATLSEIAIGDKINVWGKYSDDAKLIIDAKLVRDVSIQKRKGAFIGTVTSISGNTIKLQTISRGTQTITVDPNKTKFINRKEEKIAQTDMQINHKIRVKGLWDSTNNTITEVTELKDFSLPLK